MKKTKKKYRLKFQGIVVIVLVLYIIITAIFSFLNKKITNIYVLNNSYLTDQRIIEIAGIEEYPSTITNTCSVIKKRLEKDTYINSANVYKKNITEVYIEVIENRPLFYKSSSNKTVLLNGVEVKDIYSVPTLINYVPDTIYNEFLKNMQSISTSIIDRISEIEYNPNEVDSERFLLTMNDNNYVYLTLYKFDRINNYVDIIRNFEGKKGILYLDSGTYFKVMQ